jgi:hypothetical protein
MASWSRSVSWFQIPQTFSQVSRLVPLKKVACSISILLVDQRSLTWTVCRGSSHLVRLTCGVYGKPMS